MADALTRYRERKFILSILPTVSACVALLTELITGGEFAAIIVAVLSGYAFNKSGFVNAKPDS